VFFGKDSKISKGRADGVIDEMVQDPYCMKYIPQREAVRKVIEGNEIFFCSRECAEKFVRKRKE
jgi:YHS domain-containing protein